MSRCRRKARSAEQPAPSQTIDCTVIRAASGEARKDTSPAKITEQHYERIFGVNVRGTVFTLQMAVPVLDDGASVIFNSSVCADDGVEAFGTCAASKAALRAYARTWANELKGRGIRANAISPGTIDPLPYPRWSAPRTPRP